MKIRFWGTDGSIATPGPGSVFPAGSVTYLALRLAVFAYDGGLQLL